ncbi:unnamed protein product [Mycena citricolor]|uniref:Uncharacterized protein n=1 Tax=Mycena citricolor TaxID=2018698 RepID=A0AAD2HWP9_9AGAR|nr:unnamed protein product [Mycena citricolor]CAK5281552.1 unnamed protein product [Mycena citricolor]
MTSRKPSRQARNSDGAGHGSVQLCHANKTTLTTNNNWRARPCTFGRVLPAPPALPRGSVSKAQIGNDFWRTIVDSLVGINVGMFRFCRELRVRMSAWRPGTSVIPGVPTCGIFVARMGKMCASSIVWCIVKSGARVRAVTSGMGSGHLRWFKRVAICRKRLRLRPRCVKDPSASSYIVLTAVV